MRIGTEDKKKLKIFGVVGTLGLAAAFYMYSQLYVPDAPKTPPAPVITTTPARVQTVSKATTKGDTVMPSLDPTLKMGPMLVTEALVYSGSGRNIFSMTSAPVEMPKAVAPARPKTPLPPPAPVYTGPPPPPPIDLKFFGTATSKNGNRQAFLLHGDDVFLASPGDIVQRRYRIVSMTASSIVVVDLTNNNRQTLPLIIH